MNRADKNHLLDDVLSEKSPADFRAALLDETLRLARRRKQFRQTQRLAGIFAFAILIGGLFWRNWPAPVSISPAVAKKVASPAYQSVRTVALPQNEIVTTRTLPEGQWIASSANVIEIETTPGHFRRINDEELLALAAQRPAVLIRTGPNSERLIFAEDENGLPIN